MSEKTDQMSITYEEYFKSLADIYGNSSQYLLLTARLDAIFGKKPDLVFLKEESYPEAFKRFSDGMESNDAPEDIAASDYATLALCFALSAEYKAKEDGHEVKLEGEKLYEILVRELGSGIYDKIDIIVSMANFGRKKTTSALKSRDYDAIGEAISTLFGRQTTDWKGTYNSEYEFNTKGTTEDRLMMGIIAMRVLEYLAKHEESENAISDKKLENGRIMAEKAKLILSSARIHEFLSSHGQQTYAPRGKDRVSGQLSDCGKVICRDSYEISERDFCQMKLTEVLPYILGGTSERSFSLFEKRIGEHGITKTKALYDKSVTELLAPLFIPDLVSEEDTKKLTGVLDDPMKLAQSVEEKADAVLCRELAVFEHRTYGGLKIIRKILHKMTGKYEAMVRAAQNYLILHGGMVPTPRDLNGKDDLKADKPSKFVKDYKFEWLSNNGFNWIPCHLELGAEEEEKDESAEADGFGYRDEADAYGDTDELPDPDTVSEEADDAGPKNSKTAFDMNDDIDEYYKNGNF